MRKELKQQSRPGQRSTGSSSASDVDLTFHTVRESGVALDGKYQVEAEETRKLESNMGSNGQGSITVVAPAECQTRAAGQWSLFALKLPIKASQVRAVRREIEVWSRLAEHLNVATLHEVGREGDLPCLLTPYATLGNLEHYIESLPTSDETLCYSVADLQQPLSFGIQIACGLEFLHHHAIIHSDVKPSNVLAYCGRFNADFDVILKICDLGYASASKREHDEAELQGQRLGGGTRGFAPPELRQISGENFVSERTDTWGLVMCLLYCLHGSLPKEIVGVPPQDRRECFLQLCTAGDVFEALDVRGCEVSRGVCRFIADGLQPERMARPLARECIKQLIALFQAADGATDFEQPNVHVVLRPSSMKEREYLVARHVDGDMERAKTLHAEWRTLLREEQQRERKQRSPPATLLLGAKRQRAEADACFEVTCSRNVPSGSRRSSTAAGADTRVRPRPFYIGRHKAIRKPVASSRAAR